MENDSDQEVKILAARVFVAIVIVIFLGVWWFMWSLNKGGSEIYVEPSYTSPLTPGTQETPENEWPVEGSDKG